MNDTTAANRILDENAASHSKRAEKRQKLRNEELNFQSIEGELEQNLKSAIKKSE